MADLRIVDAPVLLQESITDDVKMPTGGLGNYAIRLGDLVWYVVAKENLASKSYVDTSSKGVQDKLGIHIADETNPHKVTKEQVGLGNVDNTADIDKPVSNATKSAITTATNDMATKAYVNQKDNLKADIVYVDDKVGDLTNLTTTDKSSLVKAVNEVNDNTRGVVALYGKNLGLNSNLDGWTSDLVAEDGLTQRQINALNKIYHPKKYGTLTNGESSDTDAFQKCADALTDGGTFRFDGVAKLTRAKGYHEDLYGTEGRYLAATPNGVRNELTLNGGQPCIIFREKKDITIDLRGADIFTEVYGQGIIDLYKCENVTIIGGKFTGGGYIRNTGKYCWIPIDGNTGFGEKGTSTQGFNTTTLTPDIGTSRNNQFITEKQTSGGYGKNFPQFDGTTAPTWGSWRGGQIGTWGFGIAIIGGTNITIEKHVSHGFNAGSVLLGTQRVLDGSATIPRMRSSGDPRFLEYAPDKVTVRDCYFHDNYIGGVHMDRCLRFRMYDNVVTDMGHPNASNSHTGIDPGYGVSTSRAMPCFDFVVENNTFLRCMRKGIDAHQGSNFRFIGNHIIDVRQHGIGIAVDEAGLDPVLQPQGFHVGIIRDNVIRSRNVGIFYSNGTFGRQPAEASKKIWERLHVLIDNNLIGSLAGFYFNYGHSPFHITNNTFVFDVPYIDELPVTRNQSAIYIGSMYLNETADPEISRGVTSANIISGNKFYNSKLGNYYAFIAIENGSGENKLYKIKDNHFDITPWQKKTKGEMMYGSDKCDYRAGAASNIFYYTKLRMLDNAIICDNTVWNEFNHGFTFWVPSTSDPATLTPSSDGSGFIGYPIINGYGAIAGLQVIDGGTGYPKNLVLGVTNRGTSSGGQLNAIVDASGAITGATVVTGGSGYHRDYLLNIPNDIVRYNMSVINGSVCFDTGSAKLRATGNTLTIMKSDLSAAVSPFIIENGIHWAQTNTKSSGVANQYAIHNGMMQGGAIAFWIKVPKQENKTGIVLTPVGSSDNNAAAYGYITATMTDAGYTLTSNIVSGNGLFFVDNNPYASEDGDVSKVVLQYDTPYCIMMSSPSLSAASWVFGANSNVANNTMTMKLADITLYRGKTFLPMHAEDVFNTQKSLYGK